MELTFWRKGGGPCGPWAKEMAAKQARRASLSMTKRLVAHCRGSLLYPRLSQTGS